MYDASRIVGCDQCVRVSRLQNRVWLTAMLSPNTARSCIDHLRFLRRVSGISVGEGGNLHVSQSRSHGEVLGQLPPICSLLVSSDTELVPGLQRRSLQQAAG